MRPKPALDVTEIVRTLDVGPISIPPDTGDHYRFRIEIARLSRGRSRYEARIWRVEFYRIQPTFPQKRGQPSQGACDELLLVRDHSFGDDMTGTTAAIALRSALSRIAGRFGLR